MQNNCMKNPAAAAVFLFLVLVPAVFLGTQETGTSTVDTASTGGSAVPVQKTVDENFAARGKYLTVKIAVAGPGDEIYLWWGHIGLVIEDALSGKKLFYDWGAFSFDTENFYLDFTLGRLFYSCTVSPADYTIARIIRENRDLTLYTLDLPPEAKTELLLFAENNVLPENRNYLYHHFRENCATRVRDIIDRAVGGNFKSRYADAPGRFTLRQHVRRHTWFSPFWDWILNFLMGGGIDQSITVWEEMFLPSEIAMRASEFTYTDALGTERRLVSDVEIMSLAKGRPGTAAIPPRRWIKELLLGLGIALLFAVLKLKTAGFFTGKLGKKHNRAFLFKTEQARYIFGAAQAAFSLFFGGTGFLLFFLSFFTSHDYTYHNYNLFFVNPLLLAAVPLALVFAFGKDPKKRRNSERFLHVLWTIVFLGGIASIAIRFFPGFYQQNQPTQALVLPAAFVLSIIPGWFLRLIKR